MTSDANQQRTESQRKITQSGFVERRKKASFVAKAKFNFEKAKVIKDNFVSIYLGNLFPSVSVGQLSHGD